jgi:hypothetical protein
MMALMSDILETCAHLLRTCVLNCTGRTARLFFMLEVRGSHGVMRYVTAPESTSTGR